MIVRAILALLPALLSAEVVFSRRVYQERARTHQQIWILNLSDGSLKPLTDSARNHFQPVCSIDGSHIRFLSGTDLSNHDGVWNFDRKNGEERKISGAAQPPVPRLDQPPRSECGQTAAWGPGKTRFACASGQALARKIAAVAFVVVAGRPKLYLSCAQMVPGSFNHPTEVDHEKEKRANNSRRKKETA